jgi:hypothetical protein
VRSAAAAAAAAGASVMDLMGNAESAEVMATRKALLELLKRLYVGPSIIDVTGFMEASPPAPF